MLCRNDIPEGDSVSYVVDRTIELYRLVINKRKKERTQQAATSQGQAQNVETITLVRRSTD